MTTNTNYYEILGVPRGVEQEKIRKAYLKLSLTFHPDMPTGNAEKFQLIAKAYETLGDPVKRKAYDDAQSTAIVTDLGAAAQHVVGEYFRQFQPITS